MKPDRSVNVTRPATPRQTRGAWPFARLFLAAAIALSLSACGGCRSDAQPTGDEREQSNAHEGSADGSGEANAALTEGSADGVDLSAAPVATVNGTDLMSAGQLQAALDDMVARYERIEDRPPTTPEWRDERRRRLVQDAVHDALVRAHVIDEAITVEDDAVEAAIREELRHVYEQESLFERFLDSRGMTREEYFDHKRHELAVDEALGGAEAVEPDEDDIRQFYEDNRENWREDDRVLVSTVTLRLRSNASDGQSEEARARLSALRERIVLGGEAFEAIASEHSEASERFQEGELGWVVRGRRAQFATNGVEDQLFTLPLDTVTEPVRTQLGWQIFWIRDRRPAGIRDFDEVRDVLADPLRRRNRQRARQQLVNGLIQTADVVYHRSAWGLEELRSDAPGTSDPVE